MTLLDTSIVSLSVTSRAPKRLPKLVSYVEAAIRESGLVVSVVTAYELRRGLAAAVAHGKSLRKSVVVERLLTTASILSLDTNGGWELAAQMWARGHTSNPRIYFDEADLLIAATAAAHGQELATTDKRFADAFAALGWPLAVHCLPLE